MIPLVSPLAVLLMAWKSADILILGCLACRSFIVSASSKLSRLMSQLQTFTIPKDDGDALHLWDLVLRLWWI